MTKYDILEAVLEERYEYLEELKKSRDVINNRIKELENDVNELVMKLLHSDLQ